MVPVGLAQPAPEKQKILFNHYFSFTGTYADGLRELTAQFNKDNTDMELFQIPIDHESFKRAILKDLQTKNTADLYSYWAGAKTKSLVPMLAPIDDVWQKQNLDKVFGRGIAESASTYAGHKYLLPITRHYVSFYYNKEIFSKNNLQPPKTWNEFVHLCEQLKKKKITPIALGSKSRWPAQFWFDYILLNTAGYEYRQKLMNGEASYSDPQVQKTFALWKTLLDKGYFNSHPNELDWEGATNLVAHKKAAMTLMGSWTLNFRPSNNANWKANVDYGQFSFPSIDTSISQTALGPIDGIIIPQGTKNLAAAKTALTFFATQKAQSIIVQSSGSLPVSAEVLLSDEDVLPKEMTADIQKTEHWAFNYDLATPPSVAEIGLNMLGEFVVFPKSQNIIVKSATEKIAEEFRKIQTLNKVKE